MTLAIYYTSVISARIAMCVFQYSEYTKSSV
jgi:hypothetical protein